MMQEHLFDDDTDPGDRVRKRSSGRMILNHVSSDETTEKTPPGTVYSVNEQ
jgi:hypothetical protein